MIAILFLFNNVIQGCRKQLKMGGGAEYIIRAHLYGEKLQSHRVTESWGDGCSPPTPNPSTTCPLAGTTGGVAKAPQDH